MTPIVSIIIPCFNAERTLRSTIESALAQDVAKEVIVVDDGSSDRSGDIIRSFGDAVRAYFGPNKGAGAARNAGTKLAQSGFLQYLDSDDVLAADTLRARLDALEMSGADVAHTDWQQLIEQPDGSFRPGDIRRPPLDLIEADSETATATSRFWAPPAALLYRRTIVEAIGGWREDLKIIQDARFLFDAAARGARFAYVGGIGAYYRVRPESLSRRDNAQFIAECGRNVDEIERIWRARRVPTDLRMAALHDMWRHAAIAAAVNGLDGFGAARARLNRLGGRQTTIETAAILRACLGKTFAAAILKTGLRLKSQMLGGRVAISGAGSVRPDAIN